MRRHLSARKPVAIAAATWILATAGCGSSGEPASPEQEAVVTVAEARGLAEGSVATVEGVVTVAPGTFNSATGDQGFALQDTTGGIYVSLPDALDLDLDRRVRVSGRLGQTAEQTVLNTEAASVAALDGTEPVEPRDVTTGDVGEPIEGLLVRVSGSVTRAVVDEQPYGFQVYIDDGSGEVQVYVHLVEGQPIIDMASLTVDQVIEVTGLAAQYEETYEVAPRRAGDLVVP
ncbi:DNA-binding protein [Sorangium cellulosum]|uniref:DNA-binding protein n=1 Tax=Sorangium cellulosum TaxID=56 RepID=A0A4P2Q1T6_SORCE|nr:DNA-binding protein [Sorangium cellulosum]AUX22803.1 DNA-binding protein [Sorangium cellulosum]